MTLTVAQATKHVEHRLAGRAGDPYSTTWLANATGHWIVNAHPWRWLRAKDATLDLVADQNYVLLPSDCRTLTDVQPTDGRTRFFQLVTEKELLAYETEGTSSTLNSYGAVVHREVDDGAPQLALRLWPTPAEASSAFYSITYQRDWKVLDGDQDIIDIPEWMEPLFVLALREMAVALEEEDGSGAPAYARLDAFTRSVFWVQTCSRDGGSSKSLGSLGGGAASAPALTWDSRFDFPTVPNPS